MAINGKKLVIGVDGGGTKTNGVLMTEDGEALARASAPSSNPHSNPEHAVRAALHTLISDLVSAGKVEAEHVDGMCLGMAGCDRDADKSFIRNIVAEALPDGARIEVINDALVAMVAVLGRLHGILVISGTGSICLGCNGETGEQARSGGWGHILADEGAGYQIAVSALKAVMAQHDKRQEKTAITEKVLTALSLGAPTDIIGWLYMQGNGKAEVAALARLVHLAAEEGDSIALNILRDQAAQLIAHVEAVQHRLFSNSSEPTDLALWGGNLQNAVIYRNIFLEELERKKLPLRPVMKEAQANEGAAIYMLNQLG